VSVLASFLGYYDFKEWAGVWIGPLLMVVLLVVLILALRQMRPTKPQQIKPEASPQIAWDDIAGVDEAKDELREVVEFMRDPKRFKKLGATIPGGILLHGPPGTGKTLLAKAVAHESRANFFAQSAASFVETFVGVGAARIRRLFKVARKKAPAIVFIDELDAVGTRRGVGDVSGEKDQTLNQLLVEMDGFTARGDVVVIAASNLLDRLDPALLRPGRFDRQVFVAPPDRQGRERILQVHTRGMPLAPSVDLDLVARQTSGLTGADLANICNEAAIGAARRHAEQLSAGDFDTALERVVAGMQAKRGLNDHEKRIVAYHEAGHALCAELLPAVDRVHRISIVPRGGALGYTLNLPEEDRYLKTREELIDRMTMLLGGRAAEQLVFGSVTTGAAGDYAAVTALAAAMVDEYAMGTRVKLRRVDGGGVPAAEATLRLRDEEQADLADGAYRTALSLLSDHRRWLDALADALLEQEVLERADIDRVLAELPRTSAASGSDATAAVAAARATALDPRD
jgi:cell division protease FtsH